MKARGFKALKTNPMPLRPGDPPFMPGFRMMPNFLSRHPDAKMIRSIHEVLEAFRDGAGHDVGLMLDLNFSQRTEGFIRIAKAVEDLNLTWLECDIHDPEALATAAALDVDADRVARNGAWTGGVPTVSPTLCLRCRDH